MVRRTTRAVGADAEQIACDYLARRGLETLSRNFQSRLGEIDLIMRDRDCLVFVEVRFRSGRRKTSARLTVDHHKQRKLIRTAALYLAAQPGLAHWPTRFDVVAIDADENGAQSIEWITDAFRPRDAAL